MFSYMSWVSVTSFCTLCEAPEDYLVHSTEVSLLALI